MKDELMFEYLFIDGEFKPDEFMETQEEYGNSTPGKNEFAAKMQKRYKRASVDVVNLMELTPNSPTLGTIRFQLLKSSTSAAANYRAVCRARSRNEFFAKLSITVEETDETLFWMEVLNESIIKVDRAELAIMLKEWTEFIKVVSKARKTASDNKY
ncbi:MAG: four helix bundle protein [Saprospiraceae bacterium]